MPYEDDPLSLERDQLQQEYVRDFDLDDEAFCGRHNIDNKIRWRSLESGIPEEEIRKALRNNPALQWWYVLNPGKQNTGETWVARVVPDIPGVTNFDHPQPGTLNLVTLGRGSVVMTEAQLQQAGGHPDTKGIDFTWTYNGNLEFYVTQKHTTGGAAGGGFQGDKIAEMRDWILIANRNDSVQEPNRRFIVLVDGSYWTDARIEELRGSITASNVFVSRVVDLAGIITQL